MIAFLILCVLCSLLIAQDTPADSEALEILEVEDSGLKVVQRPHFIIAGDDYRSIQYVARLCDEMLGLAESYFPVPNEFQQPVLIQLISFEDASFRAPYRLSTTGMGEVIVSMRWGEATQFPDLCQAVARGFILSWSIHYYGFNETRSTPPWIDLALGLRLQTRVHARFRDYLRSESLMLPSLSLEQVLAPDAPLKHDIQVLGFHAYWLWEMLQNEITRREHFGYLIAELLRGTSLYPALNQVADTTEFEEDPLLWWAVGFQNSVRGRRQGIFTPEESQSLLVGYEKLVVDINGTDRDFTLREIWQYRHRPSVQAAIQWRLREMKFGLHQINPIYYNALHSLGLIYESYLNRDADFFLHLEQAYLRDKRTAESLARSIDVQLKQIESR